MIIEKVKKLLGRVISSSFGSFFRRAKLGM